MNGQKIVNTALQYLGIPYRWGGTTPDGFDCSGLVQYAYAQNGVTIPRTSQEQYNAATAISKSQLNPGDLVFSGSNPSAPSHVMMYIGDNKIVEAPYTGAVIRTVDLDTKRNITSYGTFRNSDEISTSSSNTSTGGGVFDKILNGIGYIVLVILAIIFIMLAFDVKII